MKKIWETLGLKKSGKTKVIPVTLKIVVIFSLFIIVSNLASNYINLAYNRSHQIILAKRLLVKDIKEICNFSNYQWEIQELNRDREGALENIEKKCLHEIRADSSIFLGINSDGSIGFQAGKSGNSIRGLQNDLLLKMKGRDGFLTATIGGNDYFGIYRYSGKWDMFIFRGEENSAFFEESANIFKKVSLIILCIGIACTVIGILLVRHILRFVGVITDAIMEMTERKKLEIIPLKEASNDDVTYMGMAFNSLSGTIDVLLKIFRKFADQDVVAKAYRDKRIELEGTRKELTILFTDIRGFTTMTETLGSDIISFINIHYDQAIRKIMEYDGVIASIIGDALLAVYGVIPSNETQIPINKSLAALESAYELQRVSELLRSEIRMKKEEITLERGHLTDMEEKIYRAVLIEIGVGLDGGDVFYGTIGSYQRMTNTVIGDNVNQASRLEGLTRIYNIPVICSQYVVDDIAKNAPDSGFEFVEIDTVQVKGKTEGSRIYWPIPKESVDDEFRSNLDMFGEALDLYYRGGWEAANALFDRCTLPPAGEFVERTGSPCPENWMGQWVMKTK